MLLGFIINCRDSQACGVLYNNFPFRLNLNATIYLNTAKVGIKHQSINQSKSGKKATIVAFLVSD